MKFNILIAVGLFFVAAILDAVYTSYTYAVMKHRSIYAGTLTALIYFLSAIGILSYVNNKVYLVPLALGAFFGTVFVVELEKRKKKK